ncbi:MAG: selenocysteine-specific translation elongation factor [Candidatus Adiutrix sp.]|jgi:selenocysteine-specific elongation factor|nr:selenocysteine-specific translation elongation factor [Candidatus Adiutrix sp.]
MKAPQFAVIGTAGHVDHGKTSLIKALTGIDTDRLAQEKERGITIEAGFAHLELPAGQKAGIVDVPGHERFIKNMLAGAAGIDVALLVVAADDGIMPQTREHLDILRLLGLTRGLIALTKCDLAEDDWLELVRDDLARLTRGTFLDNSPIIEVSVETGQGLPELKAALAETVASLDFRVADGRFRLPLDRVFTLTGFGTVVTGTLMDGPVKAGEAAAVYPEGLPAKIRSLEVHSRPVEVAWPGQRVAVNLNLKKEKLARGLVLAAADSLQPTLMLDVRLEVLPDSPFSVKNGSWVHLYLGAGEFLAKVVLLEKDELAEGASSFAQLRLVSPATARKDDRFVIRFYSPLITIGGGVVLDPSPLKRRRHKPQIISQMATKEAGSPLERLELAVKERPETFPALEELVRRAGLDPAQVKEDAQILVREGRLRRLTREVFIHRRELDRLRTRLQELLADWHAKNPFSPGMSLEEVRSRLLPKAGQAVADAVLTGLEEEKFLVRELGSLRLAGFTPQVNELENKLIARLERLYLDFGMTPLAASAVEPAASPDAERHRQAAFSALVRRGLLVRLDDLYYIHKTHYERSLSLFREMAAGGQTVLAAKFRDELGTSRKVAIAILEHFDKINLTKAVGAGRTLR